jgi:hypothetical protein
MLGTRGLEVIVVGSPSVFFVQVLGAKMGLSFVGYITICVGLPVLSRYFRVADGLVVSIGLALGERVYIFVQRGSSIYLVGSRL